MWTNRGQFTKQENRKSLVISHLRFFLVIPLRFERKTHALEGRCSIQLSYGTILNCGAKVRFFAKVAKISRIKYSQNNYFHIRTDAIILMVNQLHTTKQITKSKPRVYTKNISMYISIMNHK